METYDASWLQEDDQIHAHYFIIMSLTHLFKGDISKFANIK